MTNQLAGETSPYLLQHKDNPVDWLPWGEEAFRRAAAEDKPIFLSVGYAACHWCHVMAHESFEDADTARVINEHFVPVKVDREERPDVDAVYMAAVQGMTGQGGWPMTVFLAPDGTPFYGGTYFPPEERHGLPSLKRLLYAISELWAERRDEVLTQGKALVAHIQATGDLGGPEDLTRNILERSATSIVASLDRVYGGFGGAPKFPQAPVLDLLLRLEGTAGTSEALTLTLDRMASGGIFDQLGGGFHRYSVDRQWVVPHFEKMLYDNALLLRTYARAWQRFGKPPYREVAEAIAGWLLTEMRDPAGGFWSSLDADSEGVEGRFYVWSLEEVRDVTGADFDDAVARWGLTSSGNFEGANIPVLAVSGPESPAVARARSALLARRSQRVRPGTDDKVITTWNALTAAALAEAGTVVEKDLWVSAAGECMEFVFSKLCVEGRLMRSFRDGVVRYLGYADDYAFTLEACLALYEATFDQVWLERARWAADQALELFVDEEGGGFFTSGSDAEGLITRPKDIMDSPVPSANAVFALELQRIGSILQDPRYEDAAEAALRSVRGGLERAPLAFAHSLSALDFLTSNPQEIVIVGHHQERDTAALLEVVREGFRPHKVVLLTEENAPLTSTVPLLRHRPMQEGKATAYVCHRGVCNLPVVSPEDLRAQLS